MGKLSFLILLLIIIIFSAVVGACGSYLYYNANSVATSKLSPQQPDAMTDQQKQQIAVFSSLKLSLVDSIVFFGQVKNISASDKTVTLSLNNDTVVLEISDSTLIYSATDNPAQNKPLIFSDIKIGQNLYAYSRLSSDDKINVFYVAVTK